jgi:outer membrane protein insertion porin family
VVRLLASLAFALLVVVTTNAAADEPPPSTEAAPDESEAVEDDDFRPVDDSLQRIRYFLEDVEVHTNGNTSPSLIRDFVPLERGAVLDVDDPAIEAIRWRLLGTGWFRDAHLHLERGERRGWVRLVVDAEERNTLVVDQIYMGLAEGVRYSGVEQPSLFPYGGLSVTESNLLGSGMSLSAAAVVSEPQQAGRLRFSAPSLARSGFGLQVAAFVNNAREFFGDDDTLVSIRCPMVDPTDPSPAPCPEEVAARNAVVRYRRYGGSVGTTRDLGGNTRLSLDWQGELVDVLLMPDAASELRGTRVQAIDFGIDRGRSFVSALQLGLIYDRRDDPGMPTRGMLLQFRADLGTPIIGSDYEFLRMQISLVQHLRLPWGHSLRFGGFAGAVFGRAPFFYRFYASDLSDIIPSRALELNLDRRSPPNLFGTSIAEMRSEDFGARVDVGYSMPVYRGERYIYAVNAFALVGVYALASREDLRVAIPGYRGFSRVPLDLTFDIGIRMDTEIGVFQFGLSNVLGFVAQ